MQYSKLYFFAASLLIVLQLSSCLEIIYALNAGGEALTDSLGIRYKRDTSEDGVASDYGKALDIKRVANPDKTIYQTERYAPETFGYSIPMPSDDGNYVLWLKFSEVWFNAPRMKVFDVALNDIVVVKDLDIYAIVGRGVAHDEKVPFQVRQKKIVIDGKSYPFNAEIRVDFVKTELDNPKINGILVVKGTPDQIPELPPVPTIEKQYEDFEDPSEDVEDESASDNADEQRERVEEMMRESKKEKLTKPKKNAKVEAIIDPYELDETSYLIPITVALATFIVLLFCLCRL